MTLQQFGGTVWAVVSCMLREGGIVLYVLSCMCGLLPVPCVQVLNMVTCGACVPRQVTYQ